MKATVWGARGSIPVSGPAYLKYGGDSTCVEIQTAGGDTVILDAGTGVRPLGKKLLREHRKKEVHFLLTHSHWDHLMGFPFFQPLYQPDWKIHFHGCTFAQQSMRKILSQAMKAPFFPVNLSEVSAKLHFDPSCKETFHAAGLHFQSIPLSHPNFGFGFILSEGGRRLAFFPDNELGMRQPGGLDFTGYAQALRGVDVLIHDAEFLPEEYARYAKGWGHSVHLDTARLAVEARAGRLVMWHHNQDRSDREVSAMLAQVRRVAEGTPLRCDAAKPQMTIRV